MRTTISVLVAILIVLSSSANSNEPNRLPNVTSVLVEKAKRNMYLMAGRRIIKSYRIALGKNPVGPKQFEGDGKTPEGRYIIDGRNPHSAFYRALHVSYLSRSDIERASPLSKRPGRDIVIHGLRNGFGWIGRLHLLSTEPHIDHSHRGVGPYGPEADSQVPPSDNGLYHLTSI